MDEIKKCIEEASRILKQTAGVMDTNGLIVASTDERLNGTEDVAALLVMHTSEKLVQTEGRSYLLIDDRDRNSYICFIDGNDEETRINLELFGRWVLSALRERNTVAEKEAFLKNVLLENELPGDIPLKAREFKVSYSALRQAYLIRFDRAEAVDVPGTLRQLFSDEKRHYILPMDEESIVLLLEVEDRHADVVEETTGKILKALDQVMTFPVYIGVGMIAGNLKDTAKSYREASLALTVGNIFDHDSTVMRYDKLGLGRLIYQLPPTLCRMFLSEVFAPGAYEALDHETLVTIEKFFENNLNGSETSRQLFVHRNTLVYRLDKVQKITNLDLRNFDDAVLFKLASMVRQYLEGQGGVSMHNSTGKWWQT